MCLGHAFLIPLLDFFSCFRARNRNVQWSALLLSGLSSHCSCSLKPSWSSSLERESLLHAPGTSSFRKGSIYPFSAATLSA